MGNKITKAYKHTVQEIGSLARDNPLTTAAAIGSAAFAPLTFGYTTAAGLAMDAKARMDNRIAADRDNAIAQGIKDDQARRDYNIARVNSAFGIGDDATSKANAQTLASHLNDYYTNYLGEGLHQVNQGYDAANRTNRQNLARSGQIGGGVDAQQSGQTLSQYIQGRQQALGNAATAKTQLNNALTTQRQGIVSSITSNNANPDFSNLATEQSAALSNARSQLPTQQLANLFNVAGSTYNQGAVQNAWGNVGLGGTPYSPQGVQSFNKPNASRGSYT